MAKYTTDDGVEVTAELVEGEPHAIWQIKFPDGTVKEMIDTNPTTGEKVFEKNFKAVK